VVNAAGCSHFYEALDVPADPSSCGSLLLRFFKVEIVPDHAGLSVIGPATSPAFRQCEVPGGGIAFDETLHGHCRHHLAGDAGMLPVPRTT
jgi:hypothetical protein